jgi:Prolipoprotein diacylglyceryl transferase/Concanavalin A-like lectin/glucanases superfamily
LSRIWRRSEGGMAMYGGLIVTVPLSFPLLRAMQLPFGEFWDAATVTILLGMVFTRIGCLLNGCCAGRPTSAWLGLNLPDHRGEAWVHVGWNADSPPGVRVIVVSFDATGGTKGFSLFVGDDNIWKALVGTGADIITVSGPAVVFDTTNHLVLTYDGSMLTLFHNGAESTAAVTGYEHSTESRLLIGVGGPQLPEERGPWVGKLQCVALYNSALNLEQVAKHYNHGITKAA